MHACMHACINIIHIRFAGGTGKRMSKMQERGSERGKERFGGGFLPCAVYGDLFDSVDYQVQAALKIGRHARAHLTSAVKRQEEQENFIRTLVSLSHDDVVFSNKLSTFPSMDQA
jgi:hypothetical protein